MVSMVYLVGVVTVGICSLHAKMVPVAGGKMCETSWKSKYYGACTTKRKRNAFCNLRPAGHYTREIPFAECMAGWHYKCDWGVLTRHQCPKGNVYLQKTKWYGLCKKPSRFSRSEAQLPHPCTSPKEASMQTASESIKQKRNAMRKIYRTLKKSGMIKRKGRRNRNKARKSRRRRFRMEHGKRKGRKRNPRRSKKKFGRLDGVGMSLGGQGIRKSRNNQINVRKHGKLAAYGISLQK